MSPKSQELIDHEARIVLENLTPRGSEFHNDPQRCEAYLRDLKHKYHEVMIENVKLRKQLSELRYEA